MCNSIKIGFILMLTNFDNDCVAGYEAGAKYNMTPKAVVCHMYVVFARCFNNLNDM
jgi:hypothetical protein